MRSSNPLLNDSVFQTEHSFGQPMTLQGTINKTVLLLGAVIAAAFSCWVLLLRTHDIHMILWLMKASAISGFLLALVTAYKQSWSPYTAPVYALLQGFALGGASILFEFNFPGIALRSMCLTFSILFSLLAAYSSGLIPSGERFKLGVIAATGGIAGFYGISFLLSFFGIHLSSGYNAGNVLGICFSLFVVVLAALNLVLDFAFIEEGVHAGAPKYMEWYGAFSLLVTLVWLYLEILRLLSKVRRR